MNKRTRVCGTRLLLVTRGKPRQPSFVCVDWAAHELPTGLGAAIARKDAERRLWSTRECHPSVNGEPGSQNQ